MTSPMILLRVGAITAALIAFQSVHGTARACDDTRADSQAPLAETDIANEQRAGSGKNYAQLQHSMPAQIELVTGDGQQGSVATDPHRLR